MFHQSTSPTGPSEGSHQKSAKAIDVGPQKLFSKINDAKINRYHNILDRKSSKGSQDSHKISKIYEKILNKHPKSNIQRMQSVQNIP